jgi:hypothetical protein
MTTPILFLHVGFFVPAACRVANGWNALFSTGERLFQPIPAGCKGSIKN